MTIALRENAGLVSHVLVKSIPLLKSFFEIQTEVSDAPTMTLNPAQYVGISCLQTHVHVVRDSCYVKLILTVPHVHERS